MHGYRLGAYIIAEKHLSGPISLLETQAGIILGVKLKAMGSQHIACANVLWVDGSTYEVLMEDYVYHPYKNLIPNFNLTYRYHRSLRAVSAEDNLARIDGQKHVKCYHCYPCDYMMTQWTRGDLPIGNLNTTYTLFINEEQQCLCLKTID